MSDRTPTEMERRVAAATATLRRFEKVPLRLGRNDCARLVAFHLRKMGYRVKLPPSGSYASVRSGRAALEAMGFANMAEAVDSFGFERIAPAAAVVGDIVELPGEGDLGCLTVAMGNGRVAGWVQDFRGAQVLQPVEWVRAWRVAPR